MEQVVFYDYSMGMVIPLHKFVERYGGCYMDIRDSAERCLACDHQNPEWDIQQKIAGNADGIFDFSKNMIDAGAYIGIYRWNLPFRKAWLFEPNREFYMLCCANAVLHGRAYDTFVYNELLSDGHYEVDFNGYDGMENKRFAEAVREGMAAGYYHMRRMRTSMIDDRVDEYEDIGFIKVDCEGMDWRVISGARKTILRFGRPPILFENWPDYFGDTSPRGFGPGQDNRETLEAAGERNTMIRETLRDLGYDILWEWAPRHRDTHLAVRRETANATH